MLHLHLVAAPLLLRDSGQISGGRRTLGGVWMGNGYLPCILCCFGDPSGRSNQTVV